MLSAAQLVSWGSLFYSFSLFILPVRTQLTATLTDLPGTVSSAAEGRGPVGHHAGLRHDQPQHGDPQPEVVIEAGAARNG